MNPYGGPGHKAARRREGHRSSHRADKKHKLRLGSFQPKHVGSSWHASRFRTAESGHTVIRGNTYHGVSTLHIPLNPCGTLGKLSYTGLVGSSSKCPDKSKETVTQQWKNGFRSHVSFLLGQPIALGLLFQGVPFHLLHDRLPPMGTTREKGHLRFPRAI